MSAPRLAIRAAGPLVSVQDPGRPGFARFGVPQSGPLDRLAFAAANRVLGNPADAPAIEVSLGGLTVEAEGGPLRLAVAGGGFVVNHGARRGGGWQVLTLAPGEALTLRPGPWGSWAYLAVAGGVVAPRWLGSAATHWASGLGGGAVRAGAVFEIGTARAPGRAAGPFPCPVLARPSARVPVTLGPQEACFAPETLEIFTAAAWRITPARDRMGARLAGPALPIAAALDLPSGPILRGAVQVSGDGVASILTADHQTTGGYPRIATVLDCALDGLAQLRPGARIRFEPVTPAAALARARIRAAAVARYLAGLAP